MFEWEGRAGRRTLCAEELSGNVEGLAPDDNDLLSIEKLLGDDTGETTEKMTLAVNDDLKNSNCVSDDVQ